MDAGHDQVSNGKIDTLGQRRSASDETDSISLDRMLDGKPQPTEVSSHDEQNAERCRTARDRLIPKVSVGEIACAALFIGIGRRCGRRHQTPSSLTSTARSAMPDAVSLRPQKIATAPCGQAGPGKAERHSSCPCRKDAVHALAAAPSECLLLDGLEGQNSQAGHRALIRKNISWPRRSIQLAKATDRAVGSRPLPFTISSTITDQPGADRLRVLDDRRNEYRLGAVRQKRLDLRERQST